MKNKLKLTFYCFALALAAYLVIMTYEMQAIAKHVPQPNAEAMIILGAKLNGSDLSLALKNRMDTALNYLQHNQQTQVIVSGGKGSNELISEAEAMKAYLTNHHINPARIQEDTQSTSTYENILFSKKLLHDDQHVILVSNDFHILRASMIAKRQGLDVDTLAAPTPNVVKLKLYAREYLAILKSYIFDK
jgi:uncharacterized SAM-binding protein YcdF (DUF218 family)